MWPEMLVTMRGEKMCNTNQNNASGMGLKPRLYIYIYISGGQQLLGLIWAEFLAQYLFNLI